MRPCPYCRTGNMPATTDASLWADVAAKGAALVRLCLEAREALGWSVLHVVKAIVDPSSLPEAGRDDRRCPYCRRGTVTRISPAAIWPDLAMRGVGLARVYFELSSQRPNLSIYEICTVLVEGYEADLSYLIGKEPVDVDAEDGADEPDDDEPAAEVLGPDDPDDYERDANQRTHLAKSV